MSRRHETGGRRFELVPATTAQKDVSEVPLAFSLSEIQACLSQAHLQLTPHLSRPCELNSVPEGGLKMVDIFRNESRGRVFWIDTAKDLEEAKSKMKTFYARRPAKYFAFDLPTQTEFAFTPEQLGDKTGQ